MEAFRPFKFEDHYLNSRIHKCCPVVVSSGYK
jgi:hypothetical protein